MFNVEMVQTLQTDISQVKVDLLALSTQVQYLNHDFKESGISTLNRKTILSEGLDASSAGLADYFQKSLQKASVFLILHRFLTLKLLCQLPELMCHQKFQLTYQMTWFDQQSLKPLLCFPLQLQHRDAELRSLVQQPRQRLKDFSFDY